jgi:hypothetical protein
MEIVQMGRLLRDVVLGMEIDRRDRVARAMVSGRTDRAVRGMANVRVHRAARAMGIVPMARAVHGMVNIHPPEFRTKGIVPSVRLQAGRASAKGSVMLPASLPRPPKRCTR